MIQQADLEHGEAVWLFTGTSLTDADLEGFLDSIQQLMAKAPKGGRPAAIQMVERSSPPPNAEQRTRIAERTKDLVRDDAVFCMVTGNAVIRGGATAINWMRRPAYAHGVRPTFEEALAFVEQERGHPARAFERLYAAARAAEKVRLAG